MSERLLLNEKHVPKLARHARLRFDQARNQWIINAPERVFELDEIAGLVLQRLDGIKSLGLLFDDLSSEFSAPREVIQTDVLALLQPLADKGILKI